MEAKRIDFAAIPQTALKVVTAPTAFFRGMPKAGGFVEPLVFMVAMWVVSGVICGLAHALSNILGLHLYAGVAMGIVSIALMPVMYAIGGAVLGFMGAAVLFVIWKLIGSRESYECAYRCVAYLSAILPVTAVLTVIPYVGGAIGLMIYTYYLVTASTEVHAVPVRKAWLVFGIIAALFIVLSVSAQIAARRFDRSMEQATESWKGATEQMERAAKEMQEQMQKELERQKQETPSE